MSNPTQSNLVTPFNPHAPPFFFKDPALQSPTWRSAYNACLREYPMSELGRDEARKLAQVFADNLTGAGASHQE